MGVQTVVHRNISAFYREHSPVLECIPSLSHRQFRLQLPNRGFRKIRRRVRSSAELQRWLVRLAPLDVYYTVGRWLDPVALGPAPPRDRETMQFGTYSRNIFLGADLVFDIDCPPFSRRNIAKAQGITRELVSFLRERHRLSPRYLAFSGGKGFHAVYDDPFRSAMGEIADPLKREGRAREERKRLADDILAEGIGIDAPITYDTRRVIRVPGTMNAKTGYVCRPVGEAELDAPVRKLLKATPRCSYSPGILARGYDAILRIAGTTTGTAERSGVSSPPILHRDLPPETYASYLTNQVLGVRSLYVPFFRWPRKPLDRLRGRIERVQRQYGLGTVYLLDSGSEIAGFSLRTFQRRRCEKIVRAARSLDAEQFVKYKRQFLRIGPVAGPDSKTAVEAPRPLAALPAPGTEFPASRPHHEFFTGQGLSLGEYPSLHGSGACQMTFCVFEN